MKVKDEKLFGASDKVYADSKAKGLYNESQDILDTLKQRKNAIIRMITKYDDLKDDAKIKEYEDKLREVERRIENYSNSDKPMKMQESIEIGGEAISIDSIFHFPNVIEAMQETCRDAIMEIQAEKDKTPVTEKDVRVIYNSLATLQNEVEEYLEKANPDEELEESADYPEDEKLTIDKYVATYKMPNGTFFKLYKDENGNMYDQNKVPIDDEELSKYEKVTESKKLKEDAWDDNFVINMLTDEKVYWKRKSDGKEIVTSFDIFKEPTDPTEWKSEEELTKYALEEGKVILSNLDVAEKVFEGVDVDVKTSNDWPILSDYEQNALEFAEEHGIIDYDVKGNQMTWIEKSYDDGYSRPMVEYKHTLNLDTMLVEETKTSDKLFDQLKELGMTKEQAESTVKAIVNIFKNKSPEIVKESVEDVLDNLSNETVNKVSDIISKIKNLGWDGNIDTIEDYFDKALAKVEESKKLNESNAEDFIKDVEDAKLLGWDGKDETFKDYMKKVNDMRQVNKELKKENNEENTNKLKDINFKQWYMENVPEDNFLFDDLRDDTTFQDILDTLKAGNNVYDAMFKEGKGGDSTVRENVFSALSDMLNVDYDDVYYLWLYPERDNKLKENKKIKKEAVEKINDEEGKELVKKYYPEATDEQAEKIVDMWNNDNGAINPEEEFAFSTMEKWLQVSEKNGYALEDMLVESKITEADEENEEDEEIDNNILDLLQNRIGQNLTVGELNTILQGVLGKYNEVYLLTSDLYNMNPAEPQELVVFDDDDMYTITYNIEDMDNAIIQITDVELD